MIIKFCVFSEKKLRVDIYLSALFSDFSRSYIQKIIDKYIESSSIVYKIIILRGKSYEDKSK